MNFQDNKHILLFQVKSQSPWKKCWKSWPPMRSKHSWPLPIPNLAVLFASVSSFWNFEKINSKSKILAIGLECIHSPAIHELTRGIRENLNEMTGIQESERSAMALGLAHSLSRYKLKFSPDKVDTMIVQVRLSFLFAFQNSVIKGIHKRELIFLKLVPGHSS